MLPDPTGRFDGVPAIAPARDVPPVEMGVVLDAEENEEALVAAGLACLDRVDIVGPVGEWREVAAVGRRGRLDEGVALERPLADGRIIYIDIIRTPLFLVPDKKCKSFQRLGHIVPETEIRVLLYCKSIVDRTRL